MNKKVIIISIIIILVIIITIYLFYNNTDNNVLNNNTIKTQNINTQNRNTNNNNTQDNNKYNLQKVASHNSRNDCWTVIGDKVYDITNFIPKHKGGEIIIQLCGVDGTEMFNKQHSGQSKPMRVLQNLFMGLYEK